MWRDLSKKVFDMFEEDAVGISSIWSRGDFLGFEGVTKLLKIRERIELICWSDDPEPLSFMRFDHSSFRFDIIKLNYLTTENFA